LGGAGAEEAFGGAGAEEAIGGEDGLYGGTETAVLVFVLKLVAVLVTVELRGVVFAGGGLGGLGVAVGA
jgi:hypothetical protein